jgi:transposase
MRSRHRVSKLLLRQGIVYSGGRAWTGAHLAWLRRQHFDVPGLQEAFDAEHEAVLAAVARRDRLDAAIEEMAAEGEFTAVTRRLGCLRGISTLTGFGLAVEIGDWDRLSGASIGAYLGLVPTESSTGASRSQGSITKTGNSHARRLLVEAAWHHRMPYRTPGGAKSDLRAGYERQRFLTPDRMPRSTPRPKLRRPWTGFFACDLQQRVICGHRM